MAQSDKSRDALRDASWAVVLREANVHAASHWGHCFVFTIY